MKGKINKSWHGKNKMTPNATQAQKIKWHKEHQKNCGCRDAPKSLKKLLEN